MSQTAKLQKENAERTLAPRISTFGREMEHMFEDFWRHPFATLWAPGRFWPAQTMPVERPVLDVFEEKDDVVVKAEVPGLSKEDLSVEIDGSTLTIRGTKKREEKVNEEDYVYSERTYGTFSRSVQLPAEVNTGEVKASFKDGVLEVRLPRTEESKKKVVNVKIQ